MAAINTVAEQREWLECVMDMLEKHIGSTSEIVLHDYKQEYEKSVSDIRNGHITGRKIGDGSAVLGTEVSAGELKNGNRYNTIHHTRDSKILRSSTTYLRDEKGAVVGALCVHTDITQTVKLEQMLGEHNKYSVKQESAAERLDIRQMLEYFLQEGQRHIGKPPSAMSRDERIAFLKYLDDNAVFLISKSSERVCEFMSISRFTLYNYLDGIRKKDSHLNV